MSKLTLSSGDQLAYDVIDFTDPWDHEVETILFHHGLGKSGVYWRPWVRELCAEYRVVVFDSLGNGESTRPTDHAWTIQGYADDARELIDQLGIDRAHVVGEGLGGCVGIELAANTPDRVETLTLLSTPFRPAEGSGDLVAASERILDMGMEAWLAQSMPDRMDWDSLPGEMFDWYLNERLKTSPRIMVEQMRAQSSVDLEKVLSEISAPTLLLVPGRSHVAAHRQMIRMGDLIGNARVVEFPDQGQWLTFERSHECVGELKRFIDES
jgi:aminoacrylate hydrolase